MYTGELNIRSDNQQHIFLRSKLHKPAGSVQPRTRFDLRRPICCLFKVRYRPTSCDIVAVGRGWVRRNRASGYQMGPIGSKTLKGHANGPPRECLMSGWSVGDPPGSHQRAPKRHMGHDICTVFWSLSPRTSSMWHAHAKSKSNLEKLAPLGGVPKEKSDSRRNF